MQLSTPAETVSFDAPPKRRQLDLAFRDFIDGVRSWRLWSKLGWNDIVQRYRRSLLGPFWLTASMAVMVIALGTVYSRLFKTELREFLPYLCVGLLVWGYISATIAEAGSLFTGSESYIKQIRLPYTLYAFRFIWSRLIIFGHNSVIYVAVLIYYKIWPGLGVLLAIPGLILLTINLTLACLLLGMLSARFRDIPQIISSVIQIAFFVTPVMWNADLIGLSSPIVLLNPFFHLLEIVRAPLLGQSFPLTSYLAVAVITMINFCVSAAFFIRFRNRISYWV